MAVNTLDCLSELCPLPLIKTIGELKEMEEDEILIIKADHSCVSIDIEKWAKEKNYPTKTIEVGPGEWEIYIQKSKTT